MTTYTTAQARAQWRDAGTQALTIAAAVLFAAGWLVFKVLRAIATAAAAVMFAMGWTARKAGPFVVAAFREGWDSAQPKQGTRR